MMIPNIHSQPLIIAHASGGIDGINYSNSLEALNLNYKKGFRYFEIDFSWTSDGQLVCLHDWDKRFKKVFSYKTKAPLTLQQFQHALNKTTGLHPCTLQTLDDWVNKHPDVKIITDIKQDNMAAIKMIRQQYPKLTERLIPQFYQPNEYQLLKQIGFIQLIWILYQYEGSLSSVLELSTDMDLFAISMKYSQAKKSASQEMIKKGNAVLVYTVNKQKKLIKLIHKYQISGIYTDFLEPNTD
jgi:glycerophosphoryl diester phosphodiesterase